MLKKEPISKVAKTFKRGAAVIFIAELFGLAVCYKYWGQVNTDRDSRKYLRDNYPSILESYYKVGEFLDSQNRIRQIDIAYWNAEKGK